MLIYKCKGRETQINGEIAQSKVNPNVENLALTGQNKVVIYRDIILKLAIFI